MELNYIYRFQRKSKNLLRKYILKKEFIKRTRFGFLIKLDVSRDVDKHFYWGEFEHDTLNFYNKILRTGSVVIDVGANIGLYSLIASNKVGREGQVYSFEPSEWAYSRLRENINLNDFKNIEICKFGVSDKKGVVKFYKCADDAYNSLGHHPMFAVKEVVEIEVDSLDNFCRERKISKVDILKIDAEGADYLVLKGAREILGFNESPVIFCEYNKSISEGYDFSRDDLILFLKERSYKVYELKNNGIVEFDPVNSDSNEIICMKKEHLVKYGITG
jgi:FkbM family methyltransferase